MITITMNTERLKVTITGHATAEEGNQYKEICSAASALAQSLMYSISKFPADALKSAEYRPDPGNLMIRIFPEEWAALGVRNRFKAYGDGLELLAKSHPQSVTMIRDGERILPEREGNAQ